MISTELISTLRELSRADKLYIAQLLISELAQQETDFIQLNQDHPVCSHCDADETADMRLKTLQASQSSLDKMWDNVEDDIYAELL